MGSLLIALILAGCQDAGKATQPESPTILVEVGGTLQTGSLIFSQGDCLAVKIFSRSSYTHVGDVVVTNGEIIVYDSMNGVGVRKTPLAEYLRLQTPSEIHVVHLASPFTQEQATAFKNHLEGQLGRKYAIKHHLTGKRSDGLHCSEYLTDALMAADLIHANQPPRVSPGSLLKGLEQGELCTDGGRFSLKADSPPPPDNLTWCQRAWHSTANCCSSCGSQLKRWVLCR